MKRVGAANDGGGDDDYRRFMDSAQSKLVGREQLLKELMTSPSVDETNVDQENTEPANDSFDYIDRSTIESEAKAAADALSAAATAAAKKDVSQILLVVLLLDRRALSF